MFYTFPIVFCALSFLAPSSTFSAELPEKFMPELKSGKRSIPNEVIDDSIKDLVNQTSVLKEIVKSGKSNTSQSIKIFTDEMLTQLSELTALKQSLSRKEDTHSGFSPYFNIIRWLNSKKDYLSDIHQTLLEAHSSEAKKEAIWLISTFIDKLLEGLSEADDAYNQIFQQHLLGNSPALHHKLNASTYKYYTELWRQSKDPETRALAMTRLLDGVNSLNEFTTRFLGSQLHTFMPLLTFRDLELPKDFLMQGWKIHVSAKPETAHIVAQIVLPILAKACVSHKILDSEEIIRKLQSDETQKGKFITIYPLNDAHAAYIVQTLEQALKKSTLTRDDFDVPPYDLPLGETGGIFTRYGAYSGHQIMVVDSKGKPEMQDGEIVYITDLRNSGFKPDFVTWSTPFGVQTSPKSPISSKRTMKRKAGQNDLMAASSSEAKPAEATATQSPTSKPRGHTRGEHIETKEKTAKLASIIGGFAQN